MAKIRKFSVTVAVASGTGTGYTPYFSGYIESIELLTGATYADDAVDITITAEATGEAILTLTNADLSSLPVRWRPRAATCGTDGVAAEYSGDTNETAVNDRIALSRDRVAIAIAQGGTAKTGTFVVTVSDQ